MCSKASQMGPSPQLPAAPLPARIGCAGLVNAPTALKVIINHTMNLMRPSASRAPRVTSPTAWAPSSAHLAPPARTRMTAPRPFACRACPASTKIIPGNPSARLAPKVSTAPTCTPRLHARPAKPARTRLKQASRGACHAALANGATLWALSTTRRARTARPERTLRRQAFKPRLAAMNVHQVGILL